MSDFVLTTPVALLVFNRPEQTARVFAAIRAARPPRLLVVADGPRRGRPDDPERCAEVRRIVEQVDWPCELLCNYSEENLGCKMRVSSGLDWVFGQVEEAIILEDDCLPDPTFFRFCQELLHHYRDDERVMTICGTNLLRAWKTDIQDYHFSHNGCVWGWASWRRAWQYYDVKMSLWRDPAIRAKIRNILGNDHFYRQKALEFDRVVSGSVDTWDYQWSFAQLVRSGLAVIPATNLVSNIGFGADATHTVNPRTVYADTPATPCEFPLNFNQKLVPDPEYDAALHKLAQAEKPIIQKCADYFRQMFSVISGNRPA